MERGDYQQVGSSEQERIADRNDVQWNYVADARETGSCNRRVRFILCNELQVNKQETKN